MHNGVPASELMGGHLAQEQLSAAGNCVEFAKLGSDGTVAVRNSRFPRDPPSSTPARRSTP